MTEPDSSNRFWWDSQEALAEAEQTNADATQQPHEPDQGQSWEQERQALLKELEQWREAAKAADARVTHDQQQLERIHQLEQALQESQGCVNELRLELGERNLLKAQLASTEEVANLQQQALSQLKQELAEQQKALEAQETQALLKDQTVQELLATIEKNALSQQGELGHLRKELAQSRRAVQAGQKLLQQEIETRETSLEAQVLRVQELEAEILEARSLRRSVEVQLAESHRQIEALYRRLSDRAATLNQLEDHLQQAHEALEDQQQLTVTLHQTETLVSEQNATIDTLYRQIEALEIQLEQQLKIQARLQQACHELAESRDRHSSRTAELELQIGTLQEQILKSAQQAGEYEAAIQYWKDRYGTANAFAQQLKEVMEKVIADCPDELLELLMTTQSAAASQLSKPVSPTPIASPPPNKNLQVDLPAFLRKTPPANPEVS